MSVNLSSDGSPTPRKNFARFSVHTDKMMVEDPTETLGMAGVKRPNSTAQETPLPLTTSRLGNQQQQATHTANRKDSFKKQKTDVHSQSHEGSSASCMDGLMTRLSEQSAILNQQSKAMAAMDTENGNCNSGTKGSDTPSSGSIPITPATGTFVSTPTTEIGPSSGTLNTHEIIRQQQEELASYKKEMARMAEELHANRITKSTVDSLSTSSEADYKYFPAGDITEQTIPNLQNALNVSTRSSLVRNESWLLQEDARSEASEGLSTRAFANGQTIWSNKMNQGNGMNLHTSVGQGYPAVTAAWDNLSTRPYYNNNATFGPSSQSYAPGPASRPTTGQSTNFRGRNQLLNEPTHFPLDHGFRNSMNLNPPSRPGSAFETNYGHFSGFPPTAVRAGGAGSMDSMSPTMMPMGMGMGTMGMYNASAAVGTYQPRPIGSMGTRLSPEAAEFSVDAMAPTPWNAQVPRDQALATGIADLNLRQPIHDTAGTYVAPVEPMNYRRLLDRNVNCNWKYIVDKIICNNDQQASIFLQQKLKVGTAEQRYEIVDAIIGQAYPLMVNRFGNFLVQRCFEHGTPEQVNQIANAIRGNTLTLSMDAFGCHVIQKAFDAVPEEYKAIMVHELLRRIPETVIHRYACHVWQKLFELRWQDEPPQIMKYVNESLRGMWHEVALGETGSLVVQNIFENCLEEDKRPCINEVLASIDVISHGQFGNWCIQHICEHGAPADRSRAIDHILRFATEYSMDQYASKVIEKCLKIGGADFLDRYLERVCEGRPDRPRMPLIDIAGDQFGNYLVQYILTNSSSHHRELVATHVRKHMVSLRGSKYGSRVAMLCCNPALTTRPGPPVGLQLSRYGSNGSHRGGAYAGAYR